MTDKEIIKALECCLDEALEKCNECPYSVDTFMCKRMELLEDSLDLINRQQEQLEAAIAGQENLQKALAEKDREIDRLTAEKDRLIKTFGECQAEAVREFAERLKEEQSFYDGQETRIYLTEKDLDNLVKEMVGDTE